MNGLDSHPYIPNSAPDVRARMLEYLGLTSLEELHSEIPDELRLNRVMNLPAAMVSEFELRRHIENILSKNITTRDYICFLGGGCAEHYIPAVCDEINGRGEFLTAYGGESYNDFGRFQALFEYQSLMAELTGMEVVNVPTMDWGQAAATSIRMASRMTQRKTALVAGTISPERLAIIRNYCSPDILVIALGYDSNTGEILLDDLRSKLFGTAAPDDNTSAQTRTSGHPGRGGLASCGVACVYFENPSFLGAFETQGRDIADLVHSTGAELIVGVDPISLGVIAPPPEYGADIVCGDLQPLGIHMNYGGGQSGFIAARDEERYVMEYPSRLFGICPTSEPGEYAFGDVAYDRTSFGHHRHEAKEYVGTQTALWGITAGVYLSLMGPKGMQEIGETILQKAAYARSVLAAIPGVQIRFPGFNEFVVDFNDTGKTVAEINKALLARGIFGGHDLSCGAAHTGTAATTGGAATSGAASTSGATTFFGAAAPSVSSPSVSSHSGGSPFPELGQSALYCVTEVRTKAEIDFLAQALREAVVAI